MTNEKRNYLSYFLLIFLTTIYYSASAQYYKWPFVEGQSNMNVFIKGVELGDTTKIDLIACNFTQDNYQYWFFEKGSSEAYFIENPESGKIYAYLGEEGYSSESTPYSLTFNECDFLITKTNQYEKENFPFQPFCSLPRDRRLGNALRLLS